MTISAINAYKASVNKLLESTGLNAREAQGTPSFKEALNAGDGQSSQAVDMAKGIVGSFIESAHKAEAQASLAAQGKADPLVVANTMNTLATSAETLTAVVGKGVAAYQEMMRTPL